jgi:glycine/D-amino acid oxidase-like deaminating enzyme
VWGVVVSTSIADAPRHVVEELGIGSEGAREGRLFSLVTVGETSSVGSTFIEEEPDVAALAPEIVTRGAQFVPALAASSTISVRACARPAAFDGRPLIGAVPDVAGLYVCAGHGPWGISTGPASGRLVADQMLGRAPELDEFSPARWGA